MNFIQSLFHKCKMSDLNLVGKTDKHKVYSQHCTHPKCNIRHKVWFNENDEVEYIKKNKGEEELSLTVFKENGDVHHIKY